MGREASMRWCGGTNKKAKVNVLDHCDAVSFYH